MKNLANLTLKVRITRLDAVLWNPDGREVGKNPEKSVKKNKEMI